MPGRTAELWSVIEIRGERVHHKATGDTVPDSGRGDVTGRAMWGFGANSVDSGCAAA